MNQVQLIGRTTKDIEVRYTNDGLAVARFNIAINRPTKEKQADFPTVTVFGKQAENCEKYLAKGRLVGIEGSIRTGSYEDKDGKRVYTTEVVANRVEFLEWGEKQEQEEGMPNGFERLDESIPF